MATRYKVITEENRHRFNNGCNPAIFAGNFELKGWKDTANLLQLDEYDRRYIADVKLKAGEQIFRYESRGTKAGNMQPLIKVNTHKGHIYFLTPEAIQNDLPQFESRAARPEFINLMQAVIK